MSGASSLYDALENIRGIRCRRNVSLSSITSFGVGGPADVLAVAEDIEGLRKIMCSIAATGIRWFVVGAGTNVIFQDAGFSGVVLKLGSPFGGISREGMKVVAGASALLSDVLSFCVKHSLAGLERLAGIPGTIGGAVAGNAGAFGVTIGEKVDWVEGLGSGGADRRLAASEMGFGYRHVDFGSEFVLTGVALSLDPGEKEAILAEMQEIRDKRKAKQPYELPCAGSIFKNPPEMKAARLIEEAGLKGKRVGGAEVSDIHANFIVNRGGASASDLLSLIEIVRDEVWKRSSVMLELEVKVVR